MGQATGDQVNSNGLFRIAKHPDNLATSPWRGAIGIELTCTLLAVPPVICWFTRGSEEYARLLVGLLNSPPLVIPGKGYDKAPDVTFVTDGK